MKLNEILFEMGTTLVPSETGVSADIWVSSSEFQGKQLPRGHARIKIRNGPGRNDFATMYIDTKALEGNLDTNIKNEAIAFIRRNYLSLARMWEQGPDNERKWVKTLRPIQEYLQPAKL